MKPAEQLLTILSSINEDAKDVLKSLDKKWFAKVEDDPEKRIPGKKSFKSLVSSTFSYAPERKDDYEEYAREVSLSVKSDNLTVDDVTATLYTAKAGEHSPKILESGNKVRVRCTCEDYYFTWARSNLRARVSLGHNIPDRWNEEYKRDSGGTPGICKHLYALGTSAGL